MGVPHCEAASECPYPVDVILESCDGKQFGAHTTNLELYSDSFPNAGMITQVDGEVVKLAETADVVLLMLQFMHNQVQPDCEKLESGLLLNFAKAAEKYGMYPALEACKKAMRGRITGQPLDLLLIKCTYADKDGIDQIVRQTLNLPMEEVLAAFSTAPNLFIIWSRYREKWRETFPAYQQVVMKGPTSSNYRAHGNATGSCMRQKLFDTISAFLKDDPDPSLAKVDKVVTTCREVLSCSRCSIVETDAEWTQWRTRIAESIKSFPKWVDFV